MNNLCVTVFCTIVLMWSVSHYLMSKGQVVYVKSSLKENYANAKLDCERQRMVLAMSKTQSEMESLEQFITNEKIHSTVWIGLQLGNSTYPGDFTWADGTPISWTNWYTSSDRREPNHLDAAKCIARPDSTLSWHTRPCTYKYFYICQRNETSLDRTGYFTEWLRKKPRARLLKQTKALSWTSCTEQCLNVKDCNTVALHQSGPCILYQATAEDFDDDQSKEWKTYMRYTGPITSQDP